MHKDEWKKEKKWRNVYTRSEKLRRARQLGMEYPRKSQREVMDGETINVLFVCSMNRWRSPTAEKVYEKREMVNARSRGTSKKAVRTVAPSDLKWADVLLVMENKHREQLLSRFPGELKFVELHVLDIPDDYRFMDEELVQLLIETVDPLLGAWCL